MPHSLENDIAMLRSSVRQLRRIVGGLVLMLALLVLSSMAAPDADVIRARGIIIEDAAGRERILIGAPVPVVPHRIRTDTAKARAAWGAQMGGDRYMTFYRNYRHAVHGMLVLDERGFDRLAIGDSTPDPNIGRRIGPATGIQINDARGFERSGYGLLAVNEAYRVVLGLDGANGREGIALSLFDGGPAGLWAYGSDGEEFFAGRDAPAAVDSNASPTLGWRLRHRDRIAAQSVIELR